jgi:hypothetical protein
MALHCASSFLHARGIIGDERADATLVLQLHQALPAFFSRRIAFTGADFFLFKKWPGGTQPKFPRALIDRSVPNHEVTAQLDVVKPALQDG